MSEAVHVAPGADPGVGGAGRVPTPFRQRARDLVRAGLHPLAAFGLVVLLGLGAGAGALWLFAAIAEDVAASESMALDAAVAAWVGGFASPPMDVAARVASALGSEVLGVFALLTLGVCAWQRKWRTLVVVLVTLVGAQLLNDVLKELFHRARPSLVPAWIPSQAYSFPSGHATMSAAFYCLLLCLLWHAVDWRWHPLLALAAFFVIAAVGFSRIYLQAHYFTDVAAGYAAGFLWTDAVLLGDELLRARSRRRGGPVEVATHPGAPGG